MIKKRGKYQASIQVDGKSKFLGHFVVPEDAAHAYDAAALEIFGEFARLNFPPPAGICDARSDAANGGDRVRGCEEASDLTASSDQMSELVGGDMTTERIGQFLAKTRMALGVKVTALSATTGICPRTICNLEMGKATCQFSTALTIMSALGVTVRLAPPGVPSVGTEGAA